MASRSEWAERVSEWRRSGVTAAEFCVGRGFAASTLRWHSSQLGPLPAKKKQTPERFPMVHVAREGSVATGAIVIESRGVRVHVPVGADESTVAAVVHALGMGVSS